MIPKKIYFTYKTPKPPEVYREILERWHAFCPEWELHYFSDEQIFAFFRLHFSEYLEDLKKIPIGAVLADVFRYGILFIQGGMYTDIDTIPLKKIPEEWINYQAVLGYERQPSKFFETDGVQDVLCQWTLLSAPGFPLFKEALERCFENMRANNFQFHFEQDNLTQVGPLMFTDLAQKYQNRKDVLILDKDYFGVWDKTFPATERSVVKHLFHGYEGWKLQLEHPQFRFY